jgi:hypothetical protein
MIGRAKHSLVEYINQFHLPPVFPLCVISPLSLFLLYSIHGRRKKEKQF